MGSFRFDSALFAALLSGCFALVGCGPASSDGGHGPSGAPLSAAPTVDPRMASELQRAEDRANMCSAREAKAAGLRAEYFGVNGVNGLKGPVLLTRQEGPLDEAWPQAGRETARPVGAARWRGWVRPPITGRYAFHTSHEQAHIVVAGQTLASADDRVELAAGRYHPISIEIRQLAKPTTGVVPPLNLSWTTPHGARFTVPKAVLYPPSDTVESVAQSGASTESFAQRLVSAPGK